MFLQIFEFCRPIINIIQSNIIAYSFFFYIKMSIGIASYKYRYAIRQTFNHICISNTIRDICTTYCKNVSLANLLHYIFIFIGYMQVFHKNNFTILAICKFLSSF